MTARRPYMLRAFYDWLVDNDLTPHLVVDATMPGVRVPVEFIQDGQIILNIAPRAVGNLELGNDAITFHARFSGRPHSVIVPVYAVQAIYARENGAGTMFEPEEAYTNIEEETMEEGEVMGEGFVDMLASFQEWLSYAPTKGMFRGSDMTNLQTLLTMLGTMGTVGLGMIAASRKDAKDAQAKKNAAALEDAVKAVQSGTDPKQAAADLKAKADAAIARSKELTGAMEEGDVEEENTHEGDLHEALATIETLQKELNETNLLNAKLLYVNKVFKANTLSESQKAHVIAAFDKAETVKEVKLVRTSFVSEIKLKSLPVRKVLSLLFKGLSSSNTEFASRMLLSIMVTNMDSNC